jgi:hypothetical protein
VGKNGGKDVEGEIEGETKVKQKGDAEEIQ